MMSLGSDYGETRVALAMAYNTKVKLADGTETNLYDALEEKFIDENNPSYGKKLVFPEGATIIDTGENVNDYINSFSHKVLAVNQRLYGVYNDADRNALKRTAYGKLFLQYRDWLKPALNRRFGSRRDNLMLGEETEGYYRTLVNVINEIRRGEVQLMELKEQLSPEEYANIKRALFELFQFFMCWAVLNLIPWDDDKKRPWLAKYLEYMANREYHELGILTPSLTMVQEVSKTVREPFSCMSTMKSITSLANSIITPSDWTDELQSGPYKGNSTLEKNIMKAPIPVVSWYKQINKFTGDIDTSTQYYAKPW